MPVCQKLKQYFEGCDQYLMDNYLKQVSQNLGAILKRQHGDKYGFGNDIDSDLQIMNMDQKMLDDPEIKSIENYFSNLDGKIKKTGAQRFEKYHNDLMKEYSVDAQHKWQTKDNRKDHG